MFQLPRDCRTFTILQPGVQWGWNEILSNKMVFLLETLVWQKSKDAQKRNPQSRPKPFVPEFMQGELANGNKEVEAHTTDEIKDILSAPRV